jgi:hypothetical protein
MHFLLFRDFYRTGGDFAQLSATLANKVANAANAIF